MTSALRVLAILFLWLGVALPAHAAVTITFWSHELGNSFPHAFFTLRGVPDAGGAPVDVNYGFTAKSVTPAILMGTVAGKLDIATPKYIDGSDAQFSVVLTDDQYRDMLALVALWGGPGEAGRYRLNGHNCVHFVQEAARRAGLTDIERPGLMKKPRSFLKSIAQANAARVTIIDRPGRDYLPTLPPLKP
ncbi:MAG TPA: hypothetical protein VF649_06880 [Sphingomonas sp.]|uniref:hypothetical protein n=1 Tax=Sphingomonas sp. TaxID=28214 RepID=UPI002ED9C3C2